MPFSVVSPVLSNVKLLSREQAILEFNRRVLAQAQREDVPLLERLRYICIVSSNLDEFFEVRFADALEAARLTDELDDDEDLARAVVEAHALIDAGYDSSLDGEAYKSVFFQNANNSVRVTARNVSASTVDLAAATLSVGLVKRRVP